MSTARKRRVLLAAGALVLVIGAGVGTWVYWSKPPPKSEAAAGGDTGMNRDQTEQMMRDIGYVQ